MDRTSKTEHEVEGIECSEGLVPRKRRSKRHLFDQYKRPYTVKGLSEITFY